MKTREFTDYIAEDTQVTRLIYDTLLAAYRESSRDRSPAENTFGLFFCEVLKLLTGTVLRARELDHELVSQEMKRRTLTRWPYIGYGDLLHGVSTENKTYGRTQGMRARPRAVHRGVEWLSTLSGLSKRKTVGLMNTGNNRALARACLSRGYSIRFLDARPIAHRMPHLDIDLDNIMAAIDSVHAQITLPLAPDVYKTILRRHVESIVESGMPRHPGVDVLVRGSGSEFMNRVLSHVAALHNIPIIDIVHGEGFGILDEHTFGIGEQYLADAVVGYGALYGQQSQQYSLTRYTDDMPQYLSTKSDTQAGTGQHVESLDLASQKNVFYFPTSLSGDRYRYGPYRDMPDALYLQWQQHLTTLFDPLFIKAHPKERFHEALRDTHAQYITEDLRTMIDRVEVFIFDYVSSAFFLAAATNKPIIFLDLGLRNIAPHARKLMQERTHYIDVAAFGHLDRSTLLHALADIQEKKHALTHACITDSTASGRLETIFQLVEAL